MLLIMATTKYRGRFIDRARELIATGVRVMHIFASGTNYVRCDVCPANFPPPRKDCAKKGQHDDAWYECPGCKTPCIIEFT